MIVVAGHVCLDITPNFLSKPKGGLETILKPGSLVQVGEASVHVGGSVANTGLALKKFGANVKLMGKIGRDDFGVVVRTHLERQEAAEDMIISAVGNTSYSVVLAPKGIDRFFIHHSGVNDDFYYEDLNFDKIAQAKIFHFGYPTIMKSLYENQGAEMTKIFKKVKSLGVTTSLDLAAVDPQSEAANIDFKGMFENILPQVDFFLPSVEEIAYMIDKERYQEWQERAKGKDVTEILDIEQDVKPLAQYALSLGVKVVLIKCGARGIYFATAQEERFERSYRPSQVLSATGAGDTAIAAFLYAVIRGYSWEKCLQMATATGASCVETYDGISGLKSFAELQQKIEAGWEKQ